MEQGIWWVLVSNILALQNSDGPLKAPHDKPVESLAMINRWLADDSL